VAFEIPASSSAVSIAADLAVTANSSSGGYSLTLNTATAADGGETAESVAQLNYATGELRRDTNYDGELDNDFPFPDNDRDCISDPMLAELQDQHQPLDDAAAIHISGKVETVDLAHGRLTLSEVQTHDGGASLPSTLAIRCAENMRFSPPPPPPPGGGQQPPPGGGQNPPPPPPPGEEPPVHPGDMVEAAVYAAAQGDGSTGYWAAALHPLGAPGAPPAAAVTLTPQGNGAALVQWQGGAIYTGYRLLRYSSEFSGGGPGGPLNACAPRDHLDWTLDLPAGTVQYLDTATQPNQHYTYELFGLSGASDTVYLGMTQPPPNGGGGGGP
jgi:hypothetical protein